MIIDLLPIALHLSLAAFLAGLVVFLVPLDIAAAVGVAVLSGTAYMAYIISAILPLIDPQCPYHSPISAYLYFFQESVTSQ